MGKRRSTKERVQTYRAAHPEATVRDIQKACRISSPSVVQFHLTHVGKRQSALLAVADELERFLPVPSTFKGMTPVGAAKATIRMAVELIRDRASGDPSRDKKATPAFLEELKESADAE